MKQVNIYDAKTQLSKLIEMVQNGEEVVIAKAGKPVADLKPHTPKKNKIKFGTLKGKLNYDPAVFDGIDPEIQEMFYGKDWDR